MPQLSESDRRSRCFTIGLMIFVLSCLLSSGRLLMHACNVQDPNQVERRSDGRFAALKAALPERGVIGYTGDAGASPGEYYLAQYALAPLVVEYSANHAWVVGNFHAGQLPPQTHDLQVVKDFGDGVILFANRDAR